jgi:DNA modification methylase
MNQMVLNKAEILVGDNRTTLKTLASGSVQTCITSPPYWGLRDYGEDEQIGMEKTPEQFVEELCKVFDEVWRVLADDGTLWLNLGDSYSGSGKGPSGNLGAKHDERNMEHKHSAIVPDGLKPKDLVGIPWRVAFALQARGWYLRQDIIWAKPNPMPESVTDRCTKSHEYIFLLTKSAKYYYNNESIREPLSEVTIQRDKYTRQVKDGNKSAVAGVYAVDHTKDSKSNPNGRNKRSVWNVATKPYREAHFATYPAELILPCVLAGSKDGDTVLDPFSGSGTTGVVALTNNRNYIGCELNPEYAQMSLNRIDESIGMFGEVIVTKIEE